MALSAAVLAALRNSKTPQHSAATAIQESEPQQQNDDTNAAVSPWDRFRFQNDPKVTRNIPAHVKPGEKCLMVFLPNVIAGSLAEARAIAQSEGFNDLNIEELNPNWYNIMHDPHSYHSKKTSYDVKRSCPNNEVVPNPFMALMVYGKSPLEQNYKVKDESGKVLEEVTKVSPYRISTPFYSKFTPYVGLFEEEEPDVITYATGSLPPRERGGKWQTGKLRELLVQQGHYEESYGKPISPERNIYYAKELMGFTAATTLHAQFLCLTSNKDADVGPHLLDATVYNKKTTWTGDFAKGFHHKLIAAYLDHAKAFQYEDASMQINNFADFTRPVLVLVTKNVPNKDNPTKVEWDVQLTQFDTNKGKNWLAELGYGLDEFLEIHAEGLRAIAEKPTLHYIKFASLEEQCEIFNRAISTVRKEAVERYGSNGIYHYPFKVVTHDGTLNWEKAEERSSNHETADEYARMMGDDANGTIQHSDVAEKYEHPTEQQSVDNYSSMRVDTTVTTLDDLTGFTSVPELAGFLKAKSSEGDTSAANYLENLQGFAGISIGGSISTPEELMSPYWKGDNALDSEIIDIFLNGMQDMESDEL